MSNMVVNTNILALNAHRNLASVGVKQSKASERLSSGLRINSAADDAAGLAISEKMRGQIRGLDMAAKNGQDGISMLQTAEGGMQEISNMVQRIRELVVQAANDSNESEDRSKIADEISQLTDEISAMAGRVEFNKKTLLNGDYAATGPSTTGAGGTALPGTPAGSKGQLAVQVGANANQLIKFNISGMTATSLGIDGIASSIKGASSASAISGLISTVESALTRVTDARASLGAVQNRIEFTVSSLQISSENLSAAESRIRDTDMAKEMMNLTKANVLQQASTSMLAQANQAPQSVLQLLQ